MALSPMMKQYLQVKEKYADCVIFYRLGDFYEMFFDDAIEVSRLLDLTLTGRDCGLEERAPMCGVPFHAAETYIAKLIEAGKKVAICEQLTTPGESKGMLERDVVRVVTPGTVIEAELLDESSNNFIASVYVTKGKAGLAWADISTGEFFTTEFSGEFALQNIQDQLLRVMPVEIISNTDGASATLQTVELGILPKFQKFSDWAFNFDTAKKKCCKQLECANLIAFELEDKPSAVSACGALLEYFEETQKRTISHICVIKYVLANRYMVIDNNTRRNLELTRTMRDGKKQGTLLHVLNHTKTAMGARLLASWIEQPLQDADEINRRLSAVEALVDDLMLSEKLTEILSNIRDIQRLAAKISYRSINPRDCVSLRESFEQLPELKHLLSGSSAQYLRDLSNEIDLLSDVCGEISRCICDAPPVLLKDGGYIRAGYSQELDHYRELMSGGKRWIAELEAKERERTGIKNLKIGYNRVFGYYIEVTKLNQELVPVEYIRKQTIANAERYITSELKQMEDDILSASEKALQLENQIFTHLREKLLSRLFAMQATANSIAQVDTLLSFAICANKQKYVKPTVNNSDRVYIVEGRHPVVEKINQLEDFISNDALLDTQADRTIILTGPNMAGKSTYMRQVALITLMAHIGSFVPCKTAEIGICDRIFTRVGASDNLAFNQSTFMVEMTEVANILHYATKKSLIILDEVGRGTSTLDGLSIAWAVIRYINEKIGAKTLFATHYHELTELEALYPGVRNYHISVKEYNGTIIFLRKIQRGGTNRSFGIEVASLAGVPREVLKQARKILKELEATEIVKPTKQLSFDSFTEQTKDYSKIIDKITNLDLNHMSPMQALTTLMDLQDQIEVENGND